MVKSKKMSKTSIAVIVLALLLVLSLVMGMTGAWFTNKSESAQPKTMDFGTIAIDLAAEGHESDVGFYFDAEASKTLDDNTNPDKRALLPGDQVRVKLDVQKASGSEDFYYVVKVNVAIYGGTTGATEQQPIELNGNWDGKVEPVAADPEHSVAAVAGEAYDAYGLRDYSVILDGNAVYGNTYQGATIKVTYLVRAIQKAHLSAAQAWTMLTENYADNGLIQAPAVSSGE